MMKSILFILAAVLFSAFSLWAEDIVLIDAQGKVEIKQPGESWIPAAAGTALSMQTQISTGFNSSAVLEIGNSRTTIQPLTRLEIREVQLKEREQQTALFLGAGRIRAEVKKSQDISVNYTVTTPVATAAVRGTEFEVTTRTLIVREGVVQFDSNGYQVFVPKGGTSAVTENLGNPVADPFDRAVEKRAGIPRFSEYTANRRSRGAAGEHTGQPVISIR